MEGFDKKEELDSRFREEIYSKAVRAGKRTYFFDVKATRNDEYYLTVTESKKRYDQDGKFHFEKHKIFLYKEDFEKFTDGLEEVLTFIKENQPVGEGMESGYVLEVSVQDEAEETTEVLKKDYTNVDFDDLNK